MVFTLSSPAFENGGRIPSRHARNGENLSPLLQWSDPPPGTKSFVLVLEDSDAEAARGLLAETDLTATCIATSS